MTAKTKSKVSFDPVVYGLDLPCEVSQEDREWCLQVNQKIWRFTIDRLGLTHGFPSTDRKLTRSELTRMLKLITDHKLPCVLHSGPYGGLSMSVYDHVDYAPDIKPGRLFEIDERHVWTELARDITWDDHFNWFSRYTHNDVNRQMVAFYKLPEPQPKGRYEY
jgi:hypothetical protein